MDKQNPLFIDAMLDAMLHCHFDVVSRKKGATRALHRECYPKVSPTAEFVLGTPHNTFDSTKASERSSATTDTPRERSIGVTETPEDTSVSTETTEESTVTRTDELSDDDTIPRVINHFLPKKKSEVHLVRSISALTDNLNDDIPTFPTNISHDDLAQSISISTKTTEGDLFVFDRQSIIRQSLVSLLSEISSEELVFPERPRFQKASLLPDLMSVDDFYDDRSSFSA
jgi:hypothetical protein